MLQQDSGNGGKEESKTDRIKIFRLPAQSSFYQDELGTDADF